MNHPDRVGHESEMCVCMYIRESYVNRNNKHASKNKHQLRNYHFINRVYPSFTAKSGTGDVILSLLHLKRCVAHTHLDLLLTLNETKPT